jgi:hypothetical protein
METAEDLGRFDAPGSLNRAKDRPIIPRFYHIINQDKVFGTHNCTPILRRGSRGRKAAILRSETCRGNGRKKKERKSADFFEAMLSFVAQPSVDAEAV